jgi:hypothetical protein
MKARQVEMMLKMGLDPEVDDPEDLSGLEAARAQNEAGIAKLATVNPELAQQMVDKLEGTDSADQSWFDNVKDLAGDVLSPAVSMGGKLLEVFTRPGQIIPELLTDEEDDPWYADVAQALGGNSDKYGDDVIRKYFGKDTPGWVQGLGGLGIDILGDPLTYLTFGTAGVGRATATSALGKASFGIALKEGAPKLSDDLLGFATDQMAQRLAGVGRLGGDAVDALAPMAVKGIDDEIVTAAAAKSEEIINAFSRTGLNKNLSKETIQHYRPLLEKRAATIGGMEGRGIRAGLGGVRVRAGVPFTSLRYTSGALPFTHGFGFSLPRNFFRGMSGFNRLAKATNGLDATTRSTVLDGFFDHGGWRFVEENYNALYKRATRGMPGTSSLYRASEQIGHVTERFSNHTGFWRNAGWAQVKAHNISSMARTDSRMFVDNNLLTLRDDLGNTVSTERETQRALRALATKDKTKLANYVDYIEGKADPALFTAEEKKALDLVVALRQQGMTEFNKKGGKLAHATRDINTPSEAHIDDVEWWLETGGGKGEIGGHDVWLPATADGAIDESLIDTTNGVRGIRFSTVQGENAKSGIIEVPASELKQLRDPEFRLRRTPEELDDLADDIATNGFNEPALLSMTDDGHMMLAEGNHRVEAMADDTLVPVRVERYGAEPDAYGHWVKAEDTQKYKAVASDEDTILADHTLRRGRVKTNHPLVVDLRPGAKTDGGRILDQLAAEGEQSFRKTDPAEHMLEGDLEDMVPGKVGEFTTQVLRDQGYDSVIWRYSDAEFDGVAFPPVHDADTSFDRAWNAKLINNNVEKVMGDGEYFPRIATDELKGAVGMNVGDDATVWASKLKRAERRKLESMTTREANEYLKKEYRLVGDAFVMDTIESHRLYVEQLGKDIERLYTARGVKEIEQAQRRFGTAKGLVSSNQYKWRASSTLTDEALRGLEKEHKKSLEAYSRQVKNNTVLLERQSVKLTAELEKVEEAIKGLGRSHLGVGQAKLVGQLRQQGERLGQDIRGVSVKRAKLKATLKKLDPERAPKTYLKTKTALDEAETEFQGLMAMRKELRGGKPHFTESEKLQAAREVFQERHQKLIQKMDDAGGARGMVRLKAQQRVEGAMQEINNIRARYQGVTAKSTPALVNVEEFGDQIHKMGYVSVSGIPGLEGLHAHPYMAKELTWALQGKPMNAARRAWRSWVLGPWKRWATLYYPGFHARNFMGAWFNNFLGGVTPEHYADNIKSRVAWRNPEGRQANTKLSAKKVAKYGLNPEESWTYFDLAVEMNSHGIVASNSRALHDALVDSGYRTRQITKFADRGEVAKKATKAFNAKYVSPGAYMRQMRGWTETTENFFRGSAYLAGLEHAGGDPLGARMFSMMRHGDYEDLTDAEEMIKDLVPFYKWLRTNVPFQIHNLLEAPGKQLAIVKGARESWVAAGRDPEKDRDKLADWQKQALMLPVPGGDKGDVMANISFDLPMSDLYTGANEYISSMLPVAMPFIESFVLKKSIFTGAPLEGKPVQLAGWAQLPGVRQVLEPWVTYDAEGNPTIKDTVQNTLSAIPVFSRFKNWVLADERAVKRRSAAMTSVLFGVRYEETGEEQLTANEQAFYYDILTPQIEALRELGVELPDKDMVAPEVFEHLGFKPPETDEGLPWQAAAEEG